MALRQRGGIVAGRKMLGRRATVGPAIRAALGRELAALYRAHPGNPDAPHLLALAERLAAVLDGRTDEFRNGLVQALPRLRGYGMSLTRNAADAEDLVQEAMLKALSNVEKFTPGTNLTAWLFTILRNAHYSRHRKVHREVPDPDSVFADAIPVPADQETQVEYGGVLAALEQLSQQSREVIELCVIADMKYEEVAAVFGVPVGTIKSRLSRARDQIARLMGNDRRARPEAAVVPASDGTRLADSTG